MDLSVKKREREKKEAREGWEEEGGDMEQDRGSMRFENCCHTSAGRCLMSSNSIPMSSHQEILGWSPAAFCLV